MVTSGKSARIGELDIQAKDDEVILELILGHSFVSVSLDKTQANKLASELSEWLDTRPTKDPKVQRG